jgi:hypothetical protein
LNFERQDEKNWCWVACVEMVLKHFNISPNEDEQCQIAQKGLRLANQMNEGGIAGNISCCTGNGNNPACNLTLRDGPITRLWQEYGITVDRDDGPFIGDEPATLERLKQALGARHPVQLAFGDFLGHVVMLFRWERYADGTERFFYHNPGPGSGSTDEVSSESLIHHGTRVLDATWEILRAG